MRLVESLTQCCNNLQRELFPKLQDHYKEPLNEQHKLLVTTLGLIQIENFLRYLPGLPGRPQADRQALARAFVAKAIFKIKQTNALIERLKIDKTLRQLCGWTSGSQIPSEATFSRAFAEFAEMQLPERLHEALIKEAYKDQLVGHISRDSTAIEAREKPVKKPKIDEPKRKRGRPKKGEERPQKPPRRLELQKDMTLPEMLADLPKPCDVGSKQNAKGYRQCMDRLRDAREKLLELRKSLICIRPVGSARGPWP